MMLDASDDRAPVDSSIAFPDRLAIDVSEAAGRSWAQWLRPTSGWLVSLGLHLFTVLILALLSTGAMRLSPLTNLLALSWDEPESGLAAVELLDPLQAVLESPADSHFSSRYDDDAPVAALNTEMISTVDLPDGSVDAIAVAAASLQQFDAEVSSGRVRPGAGAQFYGIEAEGSTFVFIVDRSNSMRGEKLQEAKNELMYAVRRLSAEQKFYVIFFAGWSEFMRFDPQGLPEPAPVSATTENIAKLAAWVDWIQVEPWTSPLDAVKFAMQIAPDAVFLLTDGEFTDNGRTMRFLQSNKSTKVAGSGDTRVAIHCVGFHDRAGEPALKRIAQQFGGNYRFVRPPKFATRP
jgi:hypothetical protein